MRKEQKIKTNEWMLEQTKSFPRIIVDCSFEHLMSEREIKSLLTQLKHTYSKNNDALCPSKFVFVGMSSKQQEKLIKNGMENWNASFECYPHSFEKYFAENSSHQNFLYLSSEANETLSVADFKPRTTFVVGGLVDKNRHKGICYKRAQKYNIPSAKFDLKPFFSLRKEAEQKLFINKTVLNMNHVCGILNDFSSSRNWFHAFNNNVPKRKGQKRRRSSDQTEEVTNLTQLPLKKITNINVVINVSNDIELKKCKKLLKTTSNLIIIDENIETLTKISDELNEFLDKSSKDVFERPVIMIYQYKKNSCYSLNRLKQVLNVQCDRIQNLILFEPTSYHQVYLVIQSLLKYLHLSLRLVNDASDSEKNNFSLVADQRSDSFRNTIFNEFSPTIKVISKDKSFKEVLQNLSSQVLLLKEAGQIKQILKFTFI